MSTTELSGDAVLQSAYDPPTQSIKTTISANVSGAQEVIISSLDDSIKIGDAAGHYMAINTDGSINVDANIAALNAFKTTQYTVGISAVQLTPTPLANRSSLSIKVKTAFNGDAIYIGDSSVTSSTGYPLFNGDSLQLDLTAAHSIYAIGTSANQSVYVIELG